MVSELVSQHRRAWRSRGQDGSHTKDVSFTVEQSLGFVLNKAARAMAQELSAALAPLGLTNTQWAPLMVVSQRPGLTQRELCAASGVGAPTMTEMIRRLGNKVRRVPAPADQRVWRVELGTVDTDVLNAGALAASEVNDRALSCLTTAERSELMGMLTRLTDNLRAAP